MPKPYFVAMDPDGVVHSAWRTFNLFNDETFGSTACGRAFDMDDGDGRHVGVALRVSCVTCLAEPHGGS